MENSGGSAGPSPAAFPRSQPARDSGLFDRLRTLRRRLADAENVPAYIVFSDAVLREMAERKPRSESELLAIPGIGPRKVARYGSAFLALLRGGGGD